MPVLPVTPMACPWLTVAPSDTERLLIWAYSVVLPGPWLMTT